MNLAAYTISREPVNWMLDMPHVNSVEHVDRWQDVGPAEYVRQLAGKRNDTVKKLLEEYPETEHVLCCDEYYVGQKDNLVKLVEDYEELGKDVVLGGGVWGRWRQRIRDFGNCPDQWCDRWSVKLPCYYEMVKKYGRNIVSVASISGVHVFPVSAWTNGGYGAFDDSNLGTEITWFCQHAGMPVLLDLDACFTRDKRFSIVKCIRCSVGLRTRLRKRL